MSRSYSAVATASPDISLRNHFGFASNRCRADLRRSLIVSYPVSAVSAAPAHPRIWKTPPAISTLATTHHRRRTRSRGWHPRSRGDGLDKRRPGRRENRLCRREGKSALAISAIRCTKQCKKRLVLRDRKQLPVEGRPSHLMAYSFTHIGAAFGTLKNISSPISMVPA